VGESGCGKSVTALSILRLIYDPPGRIDSGKVMFEDRNLLELSEEDIRVIRGNRISMIFQEPISSLNAVYTVGNQIGEAISAHLSISREERKHRIIDLLKRVNIPAPETRLNSYPHELSGGMCQRIMIAMALACNPTILIADEPTTALDVTIQAGILDLLSELRETIGMSVLFISHDLGVVAEITDEVYVMYAGKIVEHSMVKELFENPLHPYTIGLLNSIPGLDKRKKKLDPIPGSIPSPLDYPASCRFQDRCTFVIDKCKKLEPPLEEITKNHYSACFRARDLRADI